VNFIYQFCIIKRIPKMVIITKKTIQNYGQNHTDAIDALNDWYIRVALADWSNLNALKKDFPSCDYVGNDRYVFNIKGNRYRLIAIIHFDIRTIYIRFIGTHAEYDKIKDIENI
jgi:mRNA interferase HigB